MEDCAWDNKQVRFKGIKSKTAEGECQILRRGGHWGLKHQAKNVDWPEVIICYSFPEQFRRHRLPIVHAALAWILSDDSVDHDDLLAARSE